MNTKGTTVIGKVLIFPMNRCTLHMKGDVLWTVALSGHKNFVFIYKITLEWTYPCKMFKENISGEWPQALIHRITRGISKCEFSLEESHYRAVSGEDRKYNIYGLTYMLLLPIKEIVFCMMMDYVLKNLFILFRILLVIWIRHNFTSKGLSMHLSFLETHMHRSWCAAVLLLCCNTHVHLCKSIMLSLIIFLKTLQ